MLPWIDLRDNSWRIRGIPVHLCAGRWHVPLYRVSGHDARNE